MTEQEINVAVGDVCGWSCDSDGYWSHRDIVMRKRLRLPSGCPPSFTSDRNAMTNALATLTPEGGVRFVHELGLEVLKLCPLAGEYWMAQELDCWAMINASPKELAIAFLRVHGKWS